MPVTTNKISKQMQGLFTKKFVKGIGLLIMKFSRSIASNLPVTCLYTLIFVSSSSLASSLKSTNSFLTLVPSGLATRTTADLRTSLAVTDEAVCWGSSSAFRCGPKLAGLYLVPSSEIYGSSGINILSSTFLLSSASISSSAKSIPYCIFE